MVNNIKCLKNRLKRYLGNDEKRINMILIQILKSDGYIPKQISRLLHISINVIYKVKPELLSTEDFNAWLYAIDTERSDEWLELGKDFVRSLPQVTDTEVRLYTPFIIECMKWGMKV